MDNKKRSKQFHNAKIRKFKFRQVPLSHPFERKIGRNLEMGYESVEWGRIIWKLNIVWDLLLYI